MKTTFTLLITLLISSISIAQEFPYDFSVLNEEYNELTDPILLAGDEQWDDPSVVIPLGFTFYYFSEPTSTIYIDGDFSLGALLNTFIEKDLTTSLLIPFEADIIDANITDSLSNSTISYQVEGDAPNRICKIQWKDCAFYNEFDGNGTSNDRVNFQVWMHETSNTLEYRYGEMNIANPEENIDTNGAMVGLIDLYDLTQDTLSDAWILIDDVDEPIPTIFYSTDAIFFGDLLDDNLYEGLVYRFGSNYVSTEEFSEVQDFNIYPTLVSDFVVVDAPIGTQVQIVSIAGKTIFNGIINQKKERISTTQLSTGMYIIQLNSEGQMFSQRLVKE